MKTLRAANAAGKGIEAFWAAVAAEYPEIKTGDLDPFTVARFQGECNSAVIEWVEANTPTTRDREERESEAVEQLAELVGHFEACSYTLKATTEEMAVHFALYAKNGGELESCS